MKKPALIPVLTFLLVTGAIPLTGEVESQPLQPRSAGNGKTLFEKLSPEHTGLRHVNPILTDHPLRRQYVGGYACGGLAIGDIDGDGWQDIFAVGGPVANALYLQRHDQVSTKQLRFQDVTAKVPGLDGGDLWGAGAAFVDIDGDDDLDLFICNYDAPNQFFINETIEPGKPVLIEKAKEMGIQFVDASFMPHFVDYDRDGDLDLFILGYQYRDPKGRPRNPPYYEENGQYFLKEGADQYYGIIKDPKGNPLFTNVGRPDYLLRNDGGRFKDVTKEAGIDGVGVGNSAVWFDYNNDRYPDLYIANDFKLPDQFYVNNGDGTFTDRVKEAMPHITWFSMGSDVADLDQDGRLDLLVSDMAGTTHYRSKVSMGEMSTNSDFLKYSDPQQYMRNALFLSTESPRFLEAAYLAGLANTDWTWAVKLGDYDNDGMVDVFFTNGSARMFNHSDLSPDKEEWYGKTEWDVWADSGERHEENLAFQNTGNLKFKNVSEKWGLGEPSMSYSCAHGDLDNDGDLDLVVADLNQPIAVYQNQAQDGNRVRLRLKSAKGNRDGLGALVTLESGGKRHVRQIMPMTGFLSCNEPYLHIGLGKAATIEKLTVDWPSGARQILTNLNANHLYVIHEAGEKAGPKRYGHPLFATSRTVPAIQHREREYDDYARQPLLPYQHSQLGPGMALGDVDGDGDDDFYMCRAAGTRRAVYINEGKGQLKVRDIGPFAGAEELEDMAALFFDADTDGDEDLYVVSGGVECDPGDPLLQDRLYINDGKGNFSKASLSLPNFSGSVAAAGDVDRDGDLDLFVGGRVIPGQYPVTPASALLINESRPGQLKFSDQSVTVAPGLNQTGLVTSALWSDADGDGWLDLLVTHEWGPLKIYHNEPAGSAGRKLIDRTKESGVSKILGWWSGIAGGDIDRDGDIDYLVTNFGLNTKYKASMDKPELLFYGDMDGTGKPHLIEAKFENDICYPRRGLSCSSHAMPLVRKQMKTFHNFGMASLQELYTPKRLQESLRFEANTLETGWFKNEGKDAKGNVRFQFRPLPRMAQIAPSFGALLTDFDGNGYLDAFLAQNFHAPQVETGHMDGGLSMWLAGGPHGSFAPTGPRTSGISIRGDAMGASVTDFNRDGRPDILVSVNNGDLQAYDNYAKVLTKNRFLQIELRGRPGNPGAVGARVKLRFEDSARHSTQVAEVYAGGSYLSQSTRALFFGFPPEAKPTAIDVHWPNGKATRSTVTRPEGRTVISMPES